MGLDSSPRTKKSYIMILAFLLSAITGAIGIILWFTIRETLMVSITYSSVSVWSFSAIDNFAFLLLGIGWLVLVYFSHYYYQKGFKKGKILAHFFLITSIQVLLFFICKLSMIFIGVATGASQIFLAVLQFLVGISFLLFALRGKSERQGKSVPS